MPGLGKVAARIHPGADGEDITAEEIEPRRQQLSLPPHHVLIGDLECGGTAQPVEHVVRIVGERPVRDARAHAGRVAPSANV